MSWISTICALITVVAAVFAVRDARRSMRARRRTESATAKLCKITTEMAALLDRQRELRQR
jgi:hypothetical protein